MYLSPLFRVRKPVPEEEIAAEFRPYEAWPETKLTLEARLSGNVLNIAPKMFPWYGLVPLGALALGPSIACFFIFSVPVWFIGIMVVTVSLFLVMLWQIGIAEYAQGKPLVSISFKQKQIFYPRIGKSLHFQSIRRIWICWRYFPPRPSDDAGCYYYFLNAEVLVDRDNVVIATLALAEAPSLLRKIHLDLLRAIRRHGGPRVASTS